MNGKKFFYFLIFLVSSVSFSSALTCVDLGNNVYRYEQSANVRTLQDFLYERGYLTATPNGYFGLGTLGAVKAYQKANNIIQTGTVGPLTLTAIKKESCEGGSISQPVVISNTGRSCTDITNNVYRYEQSANVRTLQDFLYERGYLTATPNGYFGLGTLGAVKAYQKVNNIIQTGTVGPLVRAAIKKDSCGGVDQQQTVHVQKTQTQPTVSQNNKTEQLPVIKESVPLPQTQIQSFSTNNEKRWRDAEAIMVALSNRFIESFGSAFMNVSTSTKELCVAPKITQMASSSEVAVLVTPESPCKDSVDISYLEPSYIRNIPRDPTLATSSIMTGYVATRNEYNEIRIMPKVTDGKEIIIVKCQFNLNIPCSKSLTKINKEEFAAPYIDSLSRITLIKDSIPKKGLVITGKNFTENNMVTLQSSHTLRSYNLGVFASSDKKTITLPTSLMTTEFSCGDTCKEKIPVGIYQIQITNEGGVSNYGSFTVKSYNTSSLSARSNATVSANTKDVKVGTFAISVTIPSTLEGFVLRSTSTSQTLPGKLTNFKLKDSISGQTIAGGPSFGLGSLEFSENATKFYDLYIDAGDVLVGEAGLMTYGGAFIIKEKTTGEEVELPIKEIAFSVSP